MLSSGNVDFYSIQKKILDVLIHTTNDEFCTYVQSLATLYQLKQISLSTDELMIAFDNKWDDISVKAKGNPTVSETQETIMKLQAEVATLKRTKFIKQNAHKKGSKKKYTFDKNLPKHGEKWTKVKDGKTFHWCKFCRIWTPNPNHRDNSCSNNPANKENNENVNDANTTQFNFATYETFDTFRPLFQLEHHCPFDTPFCQECLVEPEEEIFESIHPILPDLVERSNDDSSDSSNNNFSVNTSNSSIWETLHAFETLAEKELSETDSLLNQSMHTVDSYDTYHDETNFNADPFLYEQNELPARIPPVTESVPSQFSYLYDEDFYFETHENEDTLELLDFFDCQDLQEFELNPNPIQTTPHSTSMVPVYLFASIIYFLQTIVSTFKGTFHSHLLFSFFLVQHFDSPCYILYIHIYVLLCLILRLITAPYFSNYIFTQSSSTSKNLVKQLYLKERKYFIYTLFKNSTHRRRYKRTISVSAFIFILLTYFLSKFQLSDSFITRRFDDTKISPMQQHSFEIQTNKHMKTSNLLSRQQELARYKIYAATVKKINKIENFDTDSVKIIIDTGASSCATNDKADFVPGTFRPMSGLVVSGISSGLVAEGYGTVRWHLTTDSDEVVELELDKVLLLKKLPIRILSPQHMAYQLNNDSDGFFAGKDKATLYFGGFKTTMPYNPTSNLPLLYTAYGIEKYKIAVTKLKTESNLTGVQRLLLQIHSKMNHVSMHYLQALARKGLLPKSIATCPVPLCAHCLTAKQEKTPAKKGNIKSEDLLPGDCVSVDQFSSPVPGLIHSFQGKPLKKKIKVCTIFVDHASSKTFIGYQETATAEETIKSKEAFEAMCQQAGVKVKKYHADNHIFNSRLFKEHVVSSQQQIEFSRVNAHFQNGVAERKIKHVTNLSRASLFQAMLSWPREISVDL